MLSIYKPVFDVIVTNQSNNTASNVKILLGCPFVSTLSYGDLVYLTTTTTLVEIFLADKLLTEIQSGKLVDILDFGSRSHFTNLNPGYIFNLT